ncbi:MAG: hypothetical protein AAF514_00925 [Verrucomicrobiota bacterium]
MKISPPGAMSLVGSVTLLCLFYLLFGKAPELVLKNVLPSKESPTARSEAAKKESLTPLPHFLEEAFVAASLATLKKNGADLTLPMPSRHLIRCATPALATEVRNWGARNQFDSANPIIFLGHDGIEYFDVELVRTEIPDPHRIREQGRLIHTELAQANGITYATWVGELVQ